MQSSTPPAAGRSGQRLSVVILLVGLASIVLAWAIDRQRTAQAARDQGWIGQLDDVRIELLTLHLELEEGLGDGGVAEAEILERLARADRAWWRFADFAEEAAGLGDREKIEASFDRMGRGLSEIETLSRERRERHLSGEDVGLDTPFEAHYDEAMESLLEILEGLESLAARHLEEHRKRSDRLLQGVFLAWALLVVFVALGWELRDRRRRALSASLEESRSRLHQAQKMEALGRMAGGIAHDINNHLATIRAHGELILRKDLGRERVVAKVERILDTVLRASSLIERLLGFGRQRPCRPEVVDLNDVVENLGRVLEGFAGEGVELELRLAEDRLPVLVDVSHLEQVLANLVVNARDAVSGQGTIGVTTSLDRERREVGLEVADDGPGIPSEHFERIFDPFFTSKEGHGGTGLGLATVYSLVQEAGGRIDVDSEVGRGATFRIRLPASDEKPRAAAGRDVASEGGGESILVVDDNEELGLATRAVLQEEGYRVTLVASTEAALQAAGEREVPFAAVITDVRVGRERGPVLVEKLRELAPLPVLYMSGYTDRIEIRAKGRRDEAFFLKKPFSADGLLRMLRKLLDQEESERGDDLQSNS